MTKARALGVIRKDLMSCFGPGSHPGCPLRGAIQGPGADHNQESLQDGVFAHRYESDPVLSDNTERWCVFTCGSFGAVKERKGETDRDGGSGGVQGRFFCRLTLQESQIASGSGYTPLFLPASVSSSFFPSIIRFFFLSPPLCLYSGSCGSRSCWAAWLRVTMSVGKQSLSRIPLSLWQSSSPMKPYQ